MSIARALLTSLFDYAGLFPPASLDLERAVQCYGRYREGEQAWALARLVIPAARLGEISADVGPLAILVGADAPERVSVAGRDVVVETKAADEAAVDAL